MNYYQKMKAAEAAANIDDRTELEKQLSTVTDIKDIKSSAHSIIIDEKKDLDEVKYKIEKSNIIVPHKNDLYYVLKDILSGDTDAVKNPLYAEFNFHEIKLALEYILALNGNDAGSLMNLLSTEAWRLNFRGRPPTPEEFLTPFYIGDSANTLYPWNRQKFIDYNSPFASYRNLILSTCIGTGKSTLTVLEFAFIAVYFALMYAPHKYYGKGATTQFTMVFSGYSQKKASELLLQPLLNLLRDSPFFHQCIRYDDMLRSNREFQNMANVDHIYWTRAAPTSEISFSNGLNVNIVSSTGDIIGQNIIMGAATEIGFWREEGGWSDERIMNFFIKLRDRIDSRMNADRISGFVLDSSPNTMESPIDKWIWSDEQQGNPRNIFLTGARWEFFRQDVDPDCYDEFGQIKHDTKKCFPMYKGGNGQMPHVVASETELASYDNIDIIWCPEWDGNISFKEKAQQDPITFLKDWAGVPAGAADRIFYQKDIIEAIFDNPLRNIYNSITAPVEEEPEHLIWNQVKDIFFDKVLDNYYYYHEPDLPRVIAIDQSISGDATCISMGHVEYDPNKLDSEGNFLKLFIIDFTVVIIPAGGIINLDAIKYFVLDLINLGNLNIRIVSFDAFQSDAQRQFLNRADVNAVYLSVDKTNAPYQSLIDYVMHKRVKIGRNLHVKNNLKSLQMTKRKTGTMKIDHIKAENVHTGSLDWDMSMIGYAAKDAADSICACMWQLNQNPEIFRPEVAWVPKTVQNGTLETKREQVEDYLAKLGL